MLNGVISDVTADQFRLGFYIFQSNEYNDLKSLRMMLTKLDIDDNQVVLKILIV